ncbi:hypothetical protein DPEC_G00364290 [Dallia pectoralis]|nr:hypothetical protein DPEC_G00364290 [Dallia pectoralis]
MAVATKNNFGIPLADPAVRCLGPHVDIFRYDVFLVYLMNELECTDAAGNPLSDGALIECLTKHRELISGPHVWSPRARAYVPFERLVHGKFARLKPSGPTVVHLLGKLLPVYCRLCLLSECHDRAKIAAQALLARLTVSKDLRDEVAQFEIRTLVYMIDNLSATLPSEWGEVCQSTDVSAETKIAVELLWCHLALVYAGNRKLLLCDLELFFARPQDSLNLCPSELRAALFVHEFSSNPSRSANYTSNAKHLLQPYFRGLFETIALSQGTCMVSTKTFTVSNENLTSYIYGVANPLTVVLCMKNTNKHFHTPFFFSSVNVSGVETKHQLFTSMSINSQRVRNVAEELPEALGKVAKLVEIHVHLNRLCCELAQERRGMLTSQEKICLVYLTETYFVNVRERSQPKYWPGYREAVRGAVVARYRSPLSPFQDKVLANYHLKNPEFIHLIPWLLDNPSTLHNNLIVAHLAYLKEECKVNARAELLATVDNHLDRNPNCRRPHGVPCLEDSDFKDLGYKQGREQHTDSSQGATRPNGSVQQKREAGALTDDCSTLHTPSSELAGEWHFLYKADTSVFGYMQLVPETVEVTSCGRHGEGTNPVKRAEFTLPSGVLSEADADDSDVGYTQLDGWCDRSLCPCCQVSFKASEFWKHALFEISDRGNRVPAWQSLDRFEVPRWIVDESAGWSNPIYRPRALESTCEVGQGLAELNLKHFLSEAEFSQALDSTFAFLTLQLRP